MKTETFYKGYTISFKPNAIAIFSEKRPEKFKKYYWVGYPMNPFIGKWFYSIEDAKKWIDSQ